MKNYVIIGGSSGIGEAIVKELSANESNSVHATYFQNQKESKANNVNYHYLNVLEDDLIFDFLPSEIHGIMYCPGSINLKPFHRIKPDAFESDYQLQVIGAIKVLQAALPKLKNATNSSIVLFSTVAVQQGFNFHAQVAASKGAIEGLTRALAAELTPNIRVNCVAPSLTDTPLASKLLSSDAKREANASRHPLQRFGSAEDIASIASFLVSDKSSWLTGQIIHVDGGISAIKG